MRAPGAARSSPVRAARLRHRPTGDHRHGDPLLGQDAGQALGSARRRRAQHHRVARLDQGRDLPGQPDPSPRIGSQPRLSTSGTSGPSAVGTSETTPAGSRPACGRRGRAAGVRSAPASRPQVEASAPARADSSSSSSPARSRTRRGSTSTTRASSPRRSVTSSSESASHGSHDSMPSNMLARRPAAPTGGGPTEPCPPAAAARCAHRLVGHQLPAAEQLDPVRGRRSTAGRPRRTGSAGRPRRPRGRCGPARRRSTGTRRRCRPARPARHGARRSTRAGSPCRPGGPPARRPTSRSPLATTTGRAAVRHGPSRWSTALTGATTTPGARSRRCGRRRPRRGCQSSRRRRPMVETSGLTRSKGRVSQAGKTSTGAHFSPGPVPPRPTKASRSWASWSAAAPVGVTTSTGRRAPSRTRPASTKAWAGVATARVAPRRADAPGSWRARRAAGREASGGSPGQGTGQCARRSAPSARRSAQPASRTGHRPVHQPAPSTRVMAMVAPSVTMSSTASAASPTAATSTSRSAAPGRFST